MSFVLTKIHKQIALTSFRSKCELPKISRYGIPGAHKSKEDLVQFGERQARVVRRGCSTGTVYL